MGLRGYGNFENFSWNRMSRVRVMEIIVMVHVDVSSCGIHCRETRLSIFNLKG